jgi:hypothetical protein
MKPDFDVQKAVRLNAISIVGKFDNVASEKTLHPLRSGAKPLNPKGLKFMAQEMLRLAGRSIPVLQPISDVSLFKNRAPMNRSSFSLILAAGLFSGAALAVTPGMAVYNNAAAFMADSAATSATGLLPSLSGNQYSAHIGSVTFSDVNGFGFWVGGLEAYTLADWTTLLPGNELAINHVENLNVTFDAPVFSAGFDFAEPGSQIGVSSPSSPHANSALHLFYDSTFSVTLKQDGAVVGDFSFNAPDETASFVGVWSVAAFNQMEIREVSGDLEDDYFGQFYTGTAALPVPEPEPYALILCGVGLIMLQLRRHHALNLLSSDPRKLPCVL